MVGNGVIWRLQGKEKCVSGSIQWCISKPIARRALLIARGALFLQASL